MTAPRFPTLEQRWGPLTPMDAGMQGRVYASGEVVVKVFRRPDGQYLHEASNMRRAGLGDWLLDTVEADGVQAIVMRRFAGQPLSAADVPRALPQVRDFLERLHAHQEGRVDLARLRERLRRFRSALAAYPLDDLFDAVEEPLARGELDVPAAFCHLDLWSDNILISAAGEVLVIDWTRAAYDDPMRDLALFKTGTLDQLPAAASVEAALGLLRPASGDPEPGLRTRLRAYLAHTYLNDLYWFLMNEPYAFEPQREFKVERARHALLHVPPG